ncbi:hypothetical protein ACH5RR_016556 [Cinchona calisaya]|uniref:Leucine-rich repeat extensin-like protein 3 n=1 Tax=Cinchona calisaya TaxID=153742 RepID=A0ABD2ZWD1_9GENT
MQVVLFYIALGRAPNCNARPIECPTDAEYCTGIPRNPNQPVVVPVPNHPPPPPPVAVSVHVPEKPGVPVLPYPRKPFQFVQVPYEVSYYYGDVIKLPSQSGTVGRPAISPPPAPHHNVPIHHFDWSPSPLTPRPSPPPPPCYHRLLLCRDQYQIDAYHPRI